MDSPRSRDRDDPTRLQVSFARKRHIALLVPLTKNQYSIWAGGPPSQIPRSLSAVPEEKHTAFLDNVRISKLGGVATDLYMSWELMGSAAEVFSFFRALGAPPVLLHFFEAHSASLIAKKRPIFLPVSHGDPHSRCVAMLLNLSERLKGLFIQFFGNRNLSPCSRCESNYNSSVINDTSNKSCLVMWPFFDCYSLVVDGVEFDHGRCGNCEHKLSAHTCTYSSVDFVPNELTSAFRASEAVNSDEELDEDILVGGKALYSRVPRPLTFTNAPKIETLRHSTYSEWREKARLAQQADLVAGVLRSG
ncbi:hypothetical protein GQ53DRAFT_877445 [Thozetella sp. PMI_491]|nr:hypothetical protein GQ53DRAFT_877445 [Thozetella sp. PMI_491]